MESTCWRSWKAGQMGFICNQKLWSGNFWAMTYTVIALFLLWHLWCHRLVSKRQINVMSLWQVPQMDGTTRCNLPYRYYRYDVFESVTNHSFCAFWLWSLNSSEICGLSAYPVHLWKGEATWEKLSNFTVDKSQEGVILQEPFWRVWNSRSLT